MRRRRARNSDSSTRSAWACTLIGQCVHSSLWCNVRAIETANSQLYEAIRMRIDSRVHQSICLNNNNKIKSIHLQLIAIRIFFFVSVLLWDPISMLTVCIGVRHRCEKFQCYSLAAPLFFRSLKFHLKWPERVDVSRVVMQVRSIKTLSMLSIALFLACCWVGADCLPVSA